MLKIEDQTVVAISGKAHHTMAKFTGRASDVIPGTVFAVTPDEIQNADKYEVAAVTTDHTGPFAMGGPSCRSWGSSND